MWVWTKKAEADFLAKWGKRKSLTRKAGTEALYDGAPLSNGFIEAYSGRGWIESADEAPPKTQWQVCVNGDKEKFYKRRWEMLKFWLSQKNVPSITLIAENMGLSRGEVLSNFVRKHGPRLAEKYGKLPYFPGGKGQKLCDAWQKVMEAKA
jgi:hypothetical protein